jgi:hypothetical protein
VLRDAVIPLPAALVDLTRDGGDAGGDGEDTARERAVAVPVACAVGGMGETGRGEARARLAAVGASKRRGVSRGGSWAGTFEYEGRRRAENLALAGPPRPTTDWVEGEAEVTTLAWPFSRLGGGFLPASTRGSRAPVGVASSPE